MMKNYDQSDKINHNPSWPYVPDYPNKILITGGSGSEKTNVLLNLKKHQLQDIDKIYLYLKDPFESKHQFLINGIEKVVMKTQENQKAFIDYSQKIADVHEKIEDYNPTKKIMLTVFSRYRSRYGV